MRSCNNPPRHLGLLTVACKKIVVGNEYLLRCSVGIEDVKAPHGTDVGEAVEAVSNGKDVNECADHCVQEDGGTVVEEVTVVQRVRRI